MSATTINTNFSSFPRVHYLEIIEKKFIRNNTARLANPTPRLSPLPLSPIVSWFPPLSLALKPPSIYLFAVQLSPINRMCVFPFPFHLLPQVPYTLLLSFLNSLTSSFFFLRFINTHCNSLLFQCLGFLIPFLLYLILSFFYLL